MNFEQRHEAIGKLIKEHLPSKDVIFSFDEDSDKFIATLSTGGYSVDVADDDWSRPVEGMYLPALAVLKQALGIEREYAKVAT